MISTKRSLQSLALVLVVFTVFTVSLTENLQIADGFSSVSTQLTYKMQQGETQMLEWGIINDSKDPLVLDMYATGPGAELFVFEEDITIEPGVKRNVEIFVIVPEDYPNNRELHPQVFAKKVTEHDKISEGAKINIGIQHVTKPVIFIGDNPVYWQPEQIDEVKPETTTEPKPKSTPKPPVVIPEGETMQEKLDRIKATNLANQLDSPDDIWEEEAVPELQVDDSYLEEPIADVPAITDSVTVEKVECGFIDWILSLFGMAKC